MSERVKTAYNIFRGGFRADPPPHWDQAPPWVRDAITVAYLQGKLDATSPTPPAPGVTEEEIARIIDPAAFGLPENDDPDSITDRDIARDRARAVLALFSKQPTLCPKCSTLYRPGERHCCAG